MKKIFLMVLCAITLGVIGARCEATIYDVTRGGDFTVIGPFDSQDLLDTLSVTVLETPYIPPRPLDPSQLSGWGLEVFGNGAFEFFACASNVGADCGYRYVPQGPYKIIIPPPVSGYPNLEVEISESHYGPDPLNKPLLFDISIDLPDGYSIAGLQPGLFPPNVPEPSTWAMLLIGFAGIGLMTYRRRKKYIFIADIFDAAIARF